MEIKTKFNIGDLVYTLSNNAVTYLPIGFIRIEINEEGKHEITYRLDKCGKCEWRGEDRVFPSKEDLIKSL